MQCLLNRDHSHSIMQGIVNTKVKQKCVQYTPAEYLQLYRHAQSYNIPLCFTIYSLRRFQDMSVCFLHPGRQIFSFSWEERAKSNLTLKYHLYSSPLFVTSSNIHPCEDMRRNRHLHSSSLLALCWVFVIDMTSYFWQMSATWRKYLHGLCTELFFSLVSFIR